MSEGRAQVSARTSDERRQWASATARNRDPILAVLARVVPAGGRVLEIASGTGEHAMYFAKRLPGVTWQPSDPDAAARASIEAWCAHDNLSNVSAPLDLDVTRTPWPLSDRPSGFGAGYEAVVCINMIHIAPWDACLALLEGSAQALDPSGILYLYGPYMRSGKHTAESNASFDRSLRTRHASWGVRDLDDVVRAAGKQRLALDEVVDMPANNLSVIFRPR